MIQSLFIFATAFAITVFLAPLTVLYQLYPEAFWVLGLIIGLFFTIKP
jgi:hypothetical protein